MLAPTQQASTICRLCGPPSRVSLFSATPAMNENDLPALIRTPPGLYRHYKGMLYEVLDTVRHSETWSP